MSETTQALAPLMPRGIQLRTVQDVIEFAKMISNTSMVPKEFRGKPADIVAVIQFGAEIGLGPMASLQNIAYINGKPSVYGDMLLALVKASPLCELVRESPPHEIARTGKAVCEVKRRGEEVVIREFSREDAERAGLLRKEGVWQQYQARMLQMRARSWACRDAFPDLLKGLVAAEEAMDIATSEPMPVGRPAIIDPTIEPPLDTEAEAHLSGLREERQAATPPAPSASKHELVTAIRQELHALRPGKTYEAVQQRMALLHQLTGAQRESELFQHTPAELSRFLDALQAQHPGQPVQLEVGEDVPDVVPPKEES